MNLTDVVLLLIILFIAFAGAANGFFKSLAGVASYVISAFAAKLAALPVAEALYKNVFQAKVTAELNTIFPSGSVQGEVSSAVQTAADSLPGYLGALLKFFTPDTSGAAGNALTVAQMEADYVAPVVTKALCWAAMIVLFIVCSLVLRIIFGALDRAVFNRKNPGVLSWVNKLLGFILGAVKGAAVVLAVCLLLNLIAPLTGENRFSENIMSSALCGFISQIF